MSAPPSSHDTPDASHDRHGRSPDDAVSAALALFKLEASVQPDDVRRRYRELLFTWHPQRYASLTNNPAKYMSMYKKGEAMTKNVEAAYNVLRAWTDAREHGPSSVV